MKRTALLVTLAFSPLLQAGEILPGSNVEVMAIDGKEVRSKIFSAPKMEVEDGKHQVVVKYVKSFKNDELIDSRPYIFTIDVKGDTEISTDRFNTRSHAKSKISSGLNWYVSNSKKQYTVDNPIQLQGSGFLPYSDIEALIAEYNGQTVATQTVAPSIESKQQTLNLNATNPIIEQYKLASKEQKKAFKLWLIDNETK